MPAAGDAEANITTTNAQDSDLMDENSRRLKRRLLVVCLLDLVSMLDPDPGLDFQDVTHSAWPCLFGPQPPMCAQSRDE